MSFNFHVHWDFPHKGYDLYSFKFVNVCVMAQNVVCLSRCSRWARVECIFCCCWMEESADITYIQCIDCGLNSPVSLPIFCLLGLSISVRGVWKSPAMLVDWFTHFPLQFYLFLFHIVWYSAVRYILVKNYVFLGNWPRYHYAVPLFILDRFPHFEVCCVKLIQLFLLPFD